MSPIPETPFFTPFPPDDAEKWPTPIASSSRSSRKSRKSRSR